MITRVTILLDLISQLSTEKNTKHKRNRELWPIQRTNTTTTENVPEKDQMVALSDNVFKTSVLKMLTELK